MIIIPDKLRRPAEVEREELRKNLAEAQAEIERKDAMIERLRSTLACARPYVADSDSLSTKRMLDTVDAALAAAEGGE
jgi:multidrug resistance efflux pump